MSRNEAGARSPASASASMPMVFVRTRTDVRAVVALLAVAIVQVIMAGTQIVVPWARIHLTVRAAPLMPGLVAAVLGYLVINSASELERNTGTRRLAPLRLGWGTTLMVICLTLAFAADARATDFGAWVLPRNALFFAGVALLGAVTLGARLAWCPVLSFVLGFFAFGIDLSTGEAKSWAWVFARQDHLMSTIIALAAAAAGLAAYALFDSRAPRGLREVDV